MAITASAFSAGVNCYNSYSPEYPVPPNAPNYAQTAPSAPGEVSSANIIRAPLGDITIVVGKPFTIIWDHKLGDTVTLTLRKGSNEKNLGYLKDIAVNIPNTGYFNWHPTSDLKDGRNYAIQISGGGGTNYSPRFPIDNKEKYGFATEDEDNNSKNSISSYIAKPSGSSYASSYYSGSASVHRSSLKNDNDYGNSSKTETGKDSKATKTYSSDASESPTSYPSRQPKDSKGDEDAKDTNSKDPKDSNSTVAKNSNSTVAKDSNSIDTKYSNSTDTKDLEANASSSTNTTSSASSQSSPGVSAVGENTSAAAGQLDSAASPLALILCIIASVLYFN